MSVREPDKNASRYWRGTGTNQDGMSNCVFREDEYNRDLEAWNNRKERVKALERRVAELEAVVESYRKGAELRAGFDWHELYVQAEAENRRLQIANEGYENYSKETKEDWVEACEELKAELKGVRAQNEAAQKLLKEIPNPRTMKNAVGDEVWIYPPVSTKIWFDQMIAALGEENKK